jgi:hypothetical protein
MIMVYGFWFGGGPLFALQDSKHLLEILPELINGNGFLRNRRRRRSKKGKLFE